MHRRYTCGVDETPVKGIYGPGAIELKAASGTDDCGLDFDGIEGFDGMDLDAGETWIGGGRTARAHRSTLAEKLQSLINRKTFQERMAVMTCQGPFLAEVSNKSRRGVYGSREASRPDLA
jgi:hypothetical protein